MPDMVTTTTDRPTVDPSYLLALQCMRRVLETVSDGISAEISDALDVLQAEQNEAEDRRLREIQDAAEAEGEEDEGDRHDG